MLRLLFCGLALICTQFSIAQFPNILIDDGFDPNEPSIWINPENTQNIVAGANLNNGYYSFDGGLTWSKQTLTSTYGVWGDPCILTDTSGNFYFLHLSNPPNGNWIDRIVCQKSTDGGITWSSGTYMGLNGNKAQDKEWAIFDKLTQNIYSTWTQFDDYGSANPNDSSVILFSRSTDYGATWSPALRINRLAGDCIDSDNTTEGAVPAVGPDGEIYVSWSNRDTLFFDRSFDEGLTWLEEDIVVAEQPGGWDYQIPGIQRCNGLPVTKCDLSGGVYHGTIYINWSDQRNGSTDTDIFFSKSADGGNSWTLPLRVNDDSTQMQQFFAWMDVDQTDGTIYILFYDRRNHPDQNTDVYLAYSTDGGESFINVKVSDTPFDPSQFTFFGDYTNISAHNGKVAPIWTRMDGGSTSIWTAQIDVATLIHEAPHAQWKNFKLSQNFPNPFTEETVIEIEIKEPGIYSLSLFDITGRRITELLSGKNLEPGNITFTLNTKTLQLHNGMYYYSLRKGNKVITKKLMVVGS